MSSLKSASACFDERWSRVAQWLVLAGSVAAVALVVPWPLVFLPTTPTGGDTPSQFAALVFFVEHILPQGRFWGWHPGNLAGFPAFQFYFPLPFLAMAGLGAFTGLEVAFKLLSLLPALALPVCVYACLSLLGLRRPGPAWGAALSVLFILSEQNTVWGGNLASLAAGEFCYGWAFALSLLYLGVLPGWLRGERGLFWPVCLLVLVGYSHAYGLLFCLVAGLYFPLCERPWPTLALRLLVVYGLAFLLLAPWTIPMLVYSPYTEQFNFVWINDSLWDFFPPTLLPALVLAPVGAVLGLWGEDPGRRSRTGFFLAWLAGAVLLYLAAPFMNTVTIRFGPFAHLAALCLAAQGCQLASQRLAGREWLLLAGATACLFWAGWRIQFVAGWLEWNCAGWEQKQPWPQVKALCAYLRPPGGGFDPGSPRVFYEHSERNGAAGSVRAFESLPLMSGRSTLEGLYLQASPNAPFIFYLQSEGCQRGSSPLPGYVYSRFDLDRALAHMRLYNVGYYIVVDPRTRRAADGNPGLVLEREFGPYSLYRVLGGDGRYAAYARYQPLLVITRRPQFIAYQWFRFTDLETPLVLVEREEQAPPGRFPRRYRDSGRPDDPLLALIRQNRLPRLALPATPAPRREKVEMERISLEGLTPGRPLIIKMSYHPAWRSSSGEIIYRVSPAFMLVFPRGRRLVLRFGPAWPHYLGLGLGVLGLVLLLPALASPGRWQRGLLAPAAAPPGQGAAGWAWRAGLLLLLGGVALALWWVHDDPNTLRLKAHRLIDQGREAEAARYLEQDLERFPMSLVADYALYDLAMTYHRRDQWRKAAELMQRLRERFPDSVVLPETLYHLALELKHLGRLQEAARVREELLRRFPDNRWSKEAAKWP